MQSSFEIRWFFLALPDAVSMWFESKGFHFSSSNPVRVDHYLPLPAKKAMGIKLREGNVEIKHLLKSTGRRGFENGRITGKIQHWVKWSFDLADADPLSHAIIRDNKHDWIAVQKERLGFKYKFTKSGREQGEIDILDMTPEGCLVEFTRLIINNKIYYTFGLESFSEAGKEKQHLRRGAKLAFESLTHWNVTHGTTIPEVRLSLADNMSYPDFLERFAK
jgi:hypothetical protein